MRRARFVLAALFLSQACGNAVYNHRIDVRVLSRDGAPLENRVSIFDHTMGYSRDWAEKAVGVSTPSQPYSGTLSSMATVTILDRSLPKSLDIAFVLPEITRDGYYLVSTELPAEAGREAQAKFVRFDEYSPQANAPAIAVKYFSTPQDKGWRVRLDVQVDSKR